MVAGRSLAVTDICLAFLSLIKNTRMAVGAVGNGLPFSKARWARLRVHGAGSVHGLLTWADRPRARGGVRNRSARRSAGAAVVVPEAS